MKPRFKSVVASFIILYGSHMPFGSVTFAQINSEAEKTLQSLGSINQPKNKSCFTSSTARPLDQATQSLVDGFCQDPQKSICGWNEKDLTDYTSRYKHDGTLKGLSEQIQNFEKQHPVALTPAEKEFEEVKKQVFVITAGKIGVDARTLNEKSFGHYLTKVMREDIGKAFDMMNDHAQTFIRMANAVAFRKTGKFPEPYAGIQKSFAASQKSVSYTVTREIHDPKEQQKILKKVAVTRLYTPADFEKDSNTRFDPKTGVRTFTTEKPNAPTKKQKDLYKNYVYACGFFEINEPSKNAVYIEELNAMMICPGFIAEHILNGSKPDDESTLLATIMSHELGHATYSKNRYPKLRNCIFDQPQKGIEKGIFDRGSIFPDFITGDSDQKRKLQNVINHENEIAADLYAVDYVASRIENLTARTANELARKKLSTLRDGYKFLCSPQLLSDGVHPSGVYRINQILGRSPAIRDAMNCRKKSSKPQFGCTLSGQTEKAY